MSFFKKFFMGSIALGFILLGGSGTQSSNILFQGGGFIGLIIGLVALYLFTKMAWKAMGCLPSLLVILGIVSFIIYAIGGFNNGIGGVVENLRTFIGGQGTMVSPQVAVSPSEESVPNLQEGFSDTPTPSQKAENKQANQPAPKSQQQGGLSGLLNSITNGVAPQRQQQEQQLDMNRLPTFTSPVSVVTADTLNVQGYKVKLYGVAAPEISQTCADRRGASYNCGQQAALWLSSWLMTNPVTCHVIREYDDGSMVAACSLGQYDIGAALVNAGWAVADPKEGKIYIPYEENAHQKRNGLWQGKFYKPWDWQAIKKRKPQYKIVDPNARKRRSFFK